MIKYVAVAVALKMFSLSSGTKKAYRFLGNRVGAKKRAEFGLPAEYIDRARRILSLFDGNNIRPENANFLELGTGWVQWESTILRLFYDAKFTLFDVWDNRQLSAFKAYFSAFLDAFDNEIEILPSKHAQARTLLKTIVSANSFDEIYDRLGFEYVVEPAGMLTKLKSDHYDACFSYNVFEHIDRTIVSKYIKDIYRLLTPGGYSIQKIEISDHLANYDQNVCGKYYLKYSDGVWKRFFENKVQYFNRIQRSEWLDIFSQAGFELLEETSLYEPSYVKINKQYKNLDRKDIECTTLEIIHRKPM